MPYAYTSTLLSTKPGALPTTRNAVAPGKDKVPKGKPPSREKSGPPQSRKKKKTADRRKGYVLSVERENIRPPFVTRVGGMRRKRKPRRSLK